MASSKRIYRIVGRLVQVFGLCLAIYGVIAGLTDFWNEPTFSKIVGGIIILAGVTLSITSEAFLLLYAIEENTRETRRILEEVKAAGAPILSGTEEEVAVSQAEGESEGEGDAEEAGAVECPECGCPIRRGKSRCPACGKYIATSSAG